MNQPFNAKDGRDSFLSNDNIQHWNNYDNAQFYENIPLELLKHYAKIAGIENGCDIEVIIPDIIQANTLLEVGTGYGRVIEFLQKKNFGGKITGVERCKKYIDLLKKPFNSTLELYPLDIHDLKLQVKFDVILWMWSGICEFSKLEQPQIINKLLSYLNEKGVLILDTMFPYVTPLNSTQSNNNYKIIKHPSWIMYGYFPSRKDINSYIENVQISELKERIYTTATNRQRVLYFIYK